MNWLHISEMKLIILTFFIGSSLKWEYSTDKKQQVPNWYLLLASRPSFRQFYWKSPIDFQISLKNTIWNVKRSYHCHTTRCTLKINQMCTKQPFDKHISNVCKYLVQFNWVNIFDHIILSNNSWLIGIWFICVMESGDIGAVRWISNLL